MPDDIVTIDKPAKKKLTIKQRKFIRELIRCGNPTEAARRVYNISDTTTSTAKCIAHQNLTKLNYTFNDLMEKMGVTDEADIELLKKLRSATKNQVCDIYVQKDEDGNYKINNNMNSFIEVDDNQTQVKALELTMRLKGRLKESANGNGNNQQIMVIVKFPEDENKIIEGEINNGQERICTDA